MSKADCLEVKGTVVKVKPGSHFDVELENGLIVDCTLSGKIRINKIKILLSDEVLVEMSPYDLTKGRISFRYK